MNKVQTVIGRVFWSNDKSDVCDVEMAFRIWDKNSSALKIIYVDSKANGLALLAKWNLHSTERFLLVSLDGVENN
jgi:hypothetical protein